MCDQFLTYSNLLVYLGFNIAAFAFISQYLSFPKDILAELSRMKRNVDLHEFPCDASRVTNELENNQASDKMKAFFLESDTVTYVTLLYLLFSIALILLIIAINLLKIGFLTNVIIFCAILYIVLIVISIVREFICNKRKWPKKYQTAKKSYLAILMALAILLGTGAIILKGDHALLFIMLISGLLIHFVLSLLPIYLRMPVTNLLVLWENLLAAEQAKTKNQ